MIPLVHKAAAAIGRSLQALEPFGVAIGLSWFGPTYHGNDLVPVCILGYLQDPFANCYEDLS